MKQSKNGKNFLIADLAGKIIGVFKDVFLGIYFLKITRRKYNRSFTLLYCIFYDIFDRLVGGKQNAKNEFTSDVSHWNFLNLMQCIVLLMMGEQISNYIIPFALFAGIGNDFYYYPEQILIKRVNNENNFQDYITKDQILKYIVTIVFPILLGYCISKSSYDLAFILLIVCLFISFVFSLGIKEVDLRHGKINLKKFFENINQKGDSKLMKLLSFRTIFRGLSSFGVLATLLTILTFLVVKTEISLGSISSFITMISILVIYFVNHFLKREQLVKIFMPLAIGQSLVVMGLTFGMIYLNTEYLVQVGPFVVSLGFLLILLYNLINGISNPIFETSNSIVYYECMSKQKITLDDEPNYVFWFEIMINVSRSLGYGILILISKIGFDLNIISYTIVGFTLMYIAFAHTLKRINQKYLVK